MTNDVSIVVATSLTAGYAEKKFCAFFFCLYIKKLYKIRSRPHFFARLKLFLQRTLRQSPVQNEFCAFYSVDVTEHFCRLQDIVTKNGVLTSKVQHAKLLNFPINFPKTFSSLYGAFSPRFIMVQMSSSSAVSVRWSSTQPFILSGLVNRV